MRNPLKLRVTIIAAGFGLSACTTPIISDPSRWDEVNQRIESLEGSLQSQYKQICTNEHAALSSRIDQAKADTKSAKAKTKKAREELAACRAEAAVRVEEKLPQKKVLLGEVESVYFIDEKKRMTVRIDTGAETSSLGVYDLREFERDGRDWVRFKLSRKESAPTFEYRVSGRKSIKQRAQDPSDSRVEIKMDIRLGKKRYSNQVFNLSDRSHLDQQAMLGRSFLQDIAVVDTALRFNLRKR